MPNAALRADARTLPEATNRRALLDATKLDTERAEGPTDLRSIGRRLERLTRERKDAKKLWNETGAAFAKSAPKLRSQYDNRDVSVGYVWDALLDPVKTSKPISREQHWRILQDMFDSQRVLTFQAVESMAKKSGYAAAAQQLRSIDAEIKQLAYRALKIRAAGLAGAKTQALALLALDQLHYGWSWMLPTAEVLAFSRAVVAIASHGKA